MHNDDCFNDASQDNCGVEVVDNSTENENESPQQENGMGKFSIQYVEPIESIHS